MPSYFPEFRWAVYITFRGDYSTTLKRVSKSRTHNPKRHSLRLPDHYQQKNSAWVEISWYWLVNEDLSVSENPIFSIILFAFIQDYLNLTFNHPMQLCNRSTVWLICFMSIKSSTWNNLVKLRNNGRRSSTCKIITFWDNGTKICFVCWPIFGLISMIRYTFTNSLGGERFEVVTLTWGQQCADVVGLALKTSGCLIFDCISVEERSNCLPASLVYGRNRN